MSRHSERPGAGSVEVNELIEALELYNDNTDGYMGGETIQLFVWPDEWTLWHLSKREAEKHKREFGGEYTEIFIPGHNKPFDAQREAMAALKRLGIRLLNPPTHAIKGEGRPRKLDAFTRAYIEAALFSSTDEEGEPLDKNYDVGDIASSTLTVMIRDCESFQEENANDLANISDEQGGHDFWLTRNRHGTGFWDRDLQEEDANLSEEAAERLTKSSHAYGEVDLYVGDDGKIYQSGAERHLNPAGLTAKGERMYEHVKAGYAGSPRAKEIAARTVYARSRTTPGLRRK